MENGSGHGQNRNAGGGTSRMSKELPFLIYCIEEYKVRRNMRGKEVIELFDRYKVCDYIIKCYEALHTTGPLYIVNDIDEYIAARKKEA